MLFHGLILTCACDVTAATKDSALCCKAWLLLMKVQLDMIPSFDVSRMCTLYQLTLVCFSWSVLHYCVNMYYKQDHCQLMENTRNY